MIFKDNFHNFKEKPLVVATITTAEDLEILKREGRPAEIDLLEFRLDNFAAACPAQLDLAGEIAPNLGPILITARHPAEGGLGNLDAEARQQLLERFLPQAAVVDLELRSLEASEALRDFAKSARDAGAAVIGSMHNFERMPEISEIQSAGQKAAKFGLDAVKTAVVVENMRDIFDLAEFVETAGIPVSAMGMGPLGKLSRLVLARAGSVLNYGFFRVANAAGQWPAAELRRLISDLSS